MVSRMHILIGALVLAVVLRSHGGVEMPCFASDDAIGHVHQHVHDLGGQAHAHLHHHQHGGHGACGTPDPAGTIAAPCVGADHDCDRHGHPAPPNLVVLPRSRSDWSAATPTTIVTLSLTATQAPIGLASLDGVGTARCLGPPGSWAGLHRRGTLLLI